MLNISQIVSHVRAVQCRPERGKMIENYIPFGYQNRISRIALSAVTHQNDRQNRKEIEEALYDRHVLIVNIDNGYFRPDGSAEDSLKAKSYLLREQMRTSSCNRRCKAILKILAPKKEDELSNNQMSLSDYGIW